jgi:hypothetical protein
MAIHVIVIHDDEEAGAEKDRVLLVDALGVSGGDRCHELKRGERVDLWLSKAGMINLRDKERAAP